MIRAKKSMFFNITLVLITFVTLLTAFLILNAKKNQFIDQRIGIKQYDLIEAYQTADQALLYLDQSSEYALRKSITELINNSYYIGEPPCGSYLDYILLKNKEKECLMSNLQIVNNLKRAFDLNLHSYLVKYPLPLPFDYFFAVSEETPLTVIGHALDSLRIDVFTREATRGAKKYYPKRYIVPTKDKEMVQKIYDIYGAAIKRATLNYPHVEDSLIGGAISQESSGDPYVISDTGCAGLMQFCYSTAIGFQHIYQKLTRCDCSGSTCKTEPKCTVQNDDRFDSSKAIQAGVEYYGQLLNHFSKYTNGAEFAVASYNGGQTVIDKAIKETGKGDPSWEEVSVSIKPEFITYFKERGEQLAKIEQIQKYVRKVMAYKQEYKLIEQRVKEEEYEVHKEEFKEETHDCCICEQLCGNDCRVYPIPEGVGCGPWSVGKGKNCDMDFCTYEYAQAAAIYEITPSFKTKLDYDFRDYPTILDAVKKPNGLLDDIKRSQEAGKTLDESIKAATTLLSKNDFEWHFDLDCDTDPEKVFNSLVENYMLCAESKDRNCTCSFSMDIGKGSSPSGWFQVQLTDVDDKTRFELVEPDEPKMVYTVDQKPYYYLHEEVVVDTEPTPQPEVPAEASAAGSPPQLKPEFSASEARLVINEKAKPIESWVKYKLYYNKGSFSKAYLAFPGGIIWDDQTELSEKGIIRIYKDEKGDVALLVKKDYQNDKVPFKYLPQCSVQKRTYRFCVTKLKDGKPEQLMVVNTETEKVEWRDLEYRFALFFPP